MGAMVLAIAALAATGAFAQTASQITPQSFRPPEERPAAGAALAPVEAAPAPEGADRLFVTLSGVDVEDAFAGMDEAGRAVAARLVGRRVSGAEIFAASSALEAAYAKAGFVLVRVVLPPQTLVDGGRLKLVVVDGFIERVDAQGVPERARARVEAVLAPLAGRRGLTLAEIERRVLLAGDAPGVLLRSTLAPGTGQGATVLVVEANYEPMGGLVSVDNSLSASLGRWSLGTGLDLNGVFGLGELVYLRATGDPNAGQYGFLNETPRNRALAAGLVLPLGADGASFNLEATQARANAIPTEGVSRASSFTRASARLRYPFVRARALNLNGEISFDAVEERQNLVVAAGSIPLARDRLRVMRLTGDGNWEAPWGGVLAARATASFGLDGLGARGTQPADAPVPLTRQFADASFSKIDAFASYAQPVVEHLSVAGFVRAQTSFGQALPQSEQIGLATPTGLSSFDAGTVQGDSGVALRAEIASPWNLPAADGVVVTLSPYLFGAVGATAFARPTELESAVRRAAAYGLGLRVAGVQKGGFAAGSLSLEWGRRGGGSGGFFEARPQGGDRFMLAVSLKL